MSRHTGTESCCQSRLEHSCCLFIQRSVLKDIDTLSHSISEEDLKTNFESDFD